LEKEKEKQILSPESSNVKVTVIAVLGRSAQQPRFFFSRTWSTSYGYVVIIFARREPILVILVVAYSGRDLSRNMIYILHGSSVIMQQDILFL
jgi:hypothetical protein